MPKKTKPKSSKPPVVKPAVPVVKPVTAVVVPPLSRLEESYAENLTAFIHGAMENQLADGEDFLSVGPANVELELGDREPRKFAIRVGSVDFEVRVEKKG